MGMPALHEEGAFAMLTDRFSAETSGPINASWKVARGVNLHLMSVADKPVEVTACKSAGNPIPDYLGCVILRSAGKSLRIATVLEPSRVAGTVTAVQLQEDGVEIALKGAMKKTFRWS
jgi:hypothetical protein